MKPDDDAADVVLDMAEDALDRGDPEGALDLCGRVLAKSPDHPGALFLSAEAYRDLHEAGEAERRYRRVTQLTPSHAASWSGLGAVLFDQLRFDDGLAAVQRALRVDPDEPEAWWWRGMLRERTGDLDGADRCFRRAARIDPEGHPAPLKLDDATLEAVVEEAVRAMHPSIREYLQQVAIVLDEVPDEDLCRQWDPPAPPGEILGYFSGASLRERSSANPWSSLPPSIVLFRRNLERIAWDHERMIDEIRITVLHEIGHFLGLDEDDLEERGLD